MPLPNNFTPFEHFQSVWMQVVNRIVREEFKDIEVDDDITTPRGSLKLACLTQDRDTAELMLLRYALFQEIRSKQVHVVSDAFTRSVRRRHKPQIMLYFVEDLSDVAEGYDPVDGRISFRLMDAGTDDDISESQARSIATRIKSSFGASNGFVWRKGKDMVSYSDWDKGYQLQLLCRDKSEGKRVIEQVLDIQGHSPEWENMNHIANEQATARYPTLPPTKSILGKSKRMPRERPIADVRFALATLTIRGMQNSLILYERLDYLNRGLIA